MGNIFPLCGWRLGRDWIDEGTLGRCRFHPPGSKGLDITIDPFAGDGGDAIDVALTKLESGRLPEITAFDSLPPAEELEHPKLEHEPEPRPPISPRKLPKSATPPERAKAGIEWRANTINEKANAVAYLLDRLKQSAIEYMTLRQCKNDLESLAPRVRARVTRSQSVAVRLLWWLSRADEGIQYGGGAIIGVGTDLLSVLRAEKEPSLRNVPADNYWTPINRTRWNSSFWEAGQTILWVTYC